MLRKQIVTTLALGVLFASSSAGAATLSFDFLLNDAPLTPAVGNISFDTLDAGLSSSYNYNNISNFQASFSIGSETWNQNDVFLKHNPNTLSFELSGVLGNRALVLDDIDNGSFDTDIFGFTNAGGNTLAFSENDDGIPNLTNDLYSINGSPTGTFSAIETSPVPVPAAVWLFGSALAGLFVNKRKSTNA